MRTMIEQLQRSRPAPDYDAISLEVYDLRREQRRRRKAKRLYRQFPVLAIDMMQSEFQGYTWEDLEADVLLRKQRKKVKSRYRKPKTYRFDWPHIRAVEPEIFTKFTEITPTRAVIRMKVNEVYYRVQFNAIYMHEYRQSRLTTDQLLTLLRGSMRALATHPAVGITEEKDNVHY